MNLHSIFAIKLLSIMNKTKTHTIITRGVDKFTRNWLKREAIKKRTSVNSVILGAIDSYIAVRIFKEKEESKSIINS